MTAPLGEFELIERIRERLALRGVAASERLVVASGDDAAVTLPGGATATSVDLTIEGVHFDLATTSPRSVGHKALAAALSDLAAMGAEPGEAYVGLGLPARIDDAEVLELTDGIAELAARWGVALAGGDVSRCDELVVALSVVGHADAPEQLVTRAGAGPGELVVVSGTLGAAAAGLELLRRPELRRGMAAEHVASLLGAQREPLPRLELGRALAAGGATAMVDLSDGLLADAGHVASASGVEIELDPERVPLAAGVTELAELAGLEPLELALAGGEDYELMACLPPARLERTRSESPAPGITEVGRTLAGPARARLSSGELPEAWKFDQLRSPGSPRARP